MGPAHTNHHCRLPGFSSAGAIRRAQRSRTNCGLQGQSRAALASFSAAESICWNSPCREAVKRLSFLLMQTSPGSIPQVTSATWKLQWGGSRVRHMNRVAPKKWWEVQATSVMRDPPPRQHVGFWGGWIIVCFSSVMIRLVKSQN